MFSIATRRFVDSLQRIFHRGTIGPVQVIAKHVHPRRIPNVAVDYDPSMAAVEISRFNTLQVEVGPVDSSQFRVNGDRTKIADTGVEECHLARAVHRRSLNSLRLAGSCPEQQLSLIHI